MTFRERWRDWRRGYTDADAENVIRKIAQEKRPGGIVLVSDSELRAHVAAGRKGYVLAQLWVAEEPVEGNP